MLETLKGVGCPPPIEKVSPEPDDDEVKPKKKKAAKNKKKKKTRKADEPDSESAYKPGDFNLIFRKFVKDKQTEGFSFKEGLKLWGASQTRARLLENMPESEKKKRRFTV